MAASAGASAAAAAYSTNATTGGADATEAAHTEAKAETPIPPAGTSSRRKGVSRLANAGNKMSGLRNGKDAV